MTVLTILLVIVGMVIWLVITNAGANFALRMGMAATGGEAVGIHGSLWRGLQIERLDYRSETLDVHGTNLRLRVDWPALAERRLSVREVAADSLRVDLRTPAEPQPEPDSGPLQPPAWPSLPGSAEVLHLQVGELILTQDGEPLPVTFQDMRAGLSADTAGALLIIDNLGVRGPDASADIQGAISAGAGDPLFLQADLRAAVRQAERTADLRLAVLGPLDHLDVSLLGTGEGMSVDARASLAPFSPTLPVTALKATVRGFDPSAWVADAPSALLNVSADVQLDGVLLTPAAAPAASADAPVGGGAGTADDDGAAGAAQGDAPAVPGKAGQGAPADASAAADEAGARPGADAAGQSDWMAQLRELRAQLHITVDEGSRWRDRPLRADVNARLENLRLPELSVLLTHADNRIEAKGALGGSDDQVDFRVALPNPQTLVDGVEGSVRLDGRLRGTLERHELNVTGRLDHPMLHAEGPAGGKPAPAARVATVAPGQNEVIEPSADAPLDLPALLQQGPLDLQLRVAGGWDAGTSGQLGPGREGWRGNVAELAVKNRRVSVALGAPAPVAVVPGEPLLWSVGETSVRIGLPERRVITLAHRASSGSGRQWRSAGRIDDFVPAWVLSQLPRIDDPLRVNLDWDLAMTQSLAGSVHLRRTRGDVALPGGPPLRAGLSELNLTLQAKPGSGGNSALSFQLDLAGKQLGSVRASGTSAVAVRDGMPEWGEQQPVAVDADIALADLAVLTPLTGDAIDVGGRLNGRLRVTRQAGVWNTGGTLQGSDLRVVLIDQGVRMLDGTLNARLVDNQFVVDSLHFPGTIRSAPRDSRVQSWLAQNAEGSAVQAQGAWSLETASGNATVTLTRFPLVQRADRFIAGSGTVNIEASPTNLDIRGKVVADVGWISLEGASDLPSLASDVVIVRAGDDAELSKPLAMNMNLEVGLGNAFYLRGMGLDTGLEGSIRILNTQAGMRARGVVNTRDGRFSIYGQTLVVDRGAVTFQGLLDDPLLDIVAVRRGLRIESGVQVSGTARNPIISLISFPDVPEVEKLSWLLLGRGPDASGADAGMLLAAAASLLGDEDSEPLYRQLGLDEMGLRSSARAGLSGLLPDRTVVSSINTANDTDADSQFLVVGKRLSDSLYLTFEQALSGRETIVRASYRISERLSAAVQGGTLTGARLIWSFVFDD
ncbi:hypothetical protein FOZ76_13980 [Verticiella sediminum]|uniref:Translocation and assembly module TamB C-terminal domain-containing protein n=1 Tax=Verticiella sediminum TaxID=1247510 RepID=A0A556AKG8_9BURK|nr:translocation/assembly module TamB domain-containing protein [Verticiella sediminum]TSH93370.1 hypothetical protein FOZ76_13980 [Verticiella sediminum]